MKPASLAHLLYGLHAFSALSGMLSAALIVTAFLTGWLAVGGILFVTLVGIPAALVVWFATGIWVLYRIIRGWLALSSGREVGVTSVTRNG